MNLRVDWEKLTSVHTHLNSLMPADADINFIMILQNGTVKRATIKFKDFLAFFWNIYDNVNYNIAALIVQDDEGHTLYRHKRLTTGNEEIPMGGHTSVIEHWSALTQQEKDMYVQMTLAQIYAYER